MQDQRKKPLILAVPGSARAGSTNHKIIEWLSTSYGNMARIRLFEAALILPAFQPGLSDTAIPDPVCEWLLQIEKADGVLFSTPEYIFSLPGMLKNALEWTVSSTVFINKPVAFIVASASGEHAIASLALILQTLTGAVVPSTHQLLIKGAQSKLNNNHSFTDDDVENSMHALMQAFLTELQ